MVELQSDEEVFRPAVTADQSTRRCLRHGYLAR